MTPNRLVALSLLAAAVAAAPARAETPDCAAPNVLILLDVSGSMKSATNPDGKYAAAIPAVTGIVDQFESSVRFGLMVFPDPAQGVCGVTTDLPVAPALGNAAAIRDYLLPDQPGFFGGPMENFDTPMKQALEAAGTLADLHDPARRSYVLLLTDGMQDCCRGGDYDDDPDCILGPPEQLIPEEVVQNRQDLVDVVSAMVEDHLPVFVVGFGAAVDGLTLNAMAQAAGTSQAGCDPAQTDPAAGVTCFYPVSSTAELLTALSSVVQIVGEEVCDGLDNNCDGRTDEGFDVGAPCDGPDADQCADGTIRCDVYGRAVCGGEPAEGHAELCNGIDDDCDGETDEGFAVGLPCDGDDADSCEDGVYVCGATGMGVVCGETGPGRSETCNGLDDTCDGRTDEDADEPCESPCGAGVRHCAGGVLGPCVGPEPARQDICGNGLDDDCDGETDEDWEEACQTDCGAGVVRCQGGVLSACDAPVPVAETCNLLDDDCNGRTDDGDLCTGGAECFCGGCQAPCAADGTCSNGRACVDGSCVIDRCPAGRHCEARTCIDGVAPVKVSKAGGGCGCRADGGHGAPDGTAVVAGLLALAWLGWRRRRPSAVGRRP